MSEPPLNLDEVDWDDDEDPPPPPEEPEPEIVSNRGKLQDRVNPLQVRRRAATLCARVAAAAGSHRPSAAALRASYFGCRFLLPLGRRPLAIARPLRPLACPRS